MRIYGPQVITAARALSAHPNSKIAKENLEVFSDMWQWLSGDVASVSKEVIETVQAISKPDRTEYLSLPRPGVSSIAQLGDIFYAFFVLIKFSFVDTFFKM